MYLLVKHHCLVTVGKVKGNRLLFLFSCEQMIFFNLNLKYCLDKKRS